MKRNLSDACAGHEVETDAAIAAADLLHKLEKGFYMDKGTVSYTHLTLPTKRIV